MATKAQILALSAQPFAQLGKASDTGEWYTIAPNAAGSTAEKVNTDIATATESVEGIVELATSTEVESGWSSAAEKIVRSSHLRLKVEGGGIVLKGTTDPTSGGANTGVDSIISGNNNHANTGGHCSIVGSNNHTNTASYCSISGQYNNGNSGHYTSISGKSNYSNSGQYSLISGDQNHTNSGTRCSISGQNNHTNSGTRCTISGYGNHTNSGNRCSISGNNNRTNSGSYCSISGYGNHTNSGHSCSISGYGNYSNTGTHCSISGYGHHTNSGKYCQISGNYNHTNSGYGCQISGGSNSSNSGDYCQISGRNAANNALDYARVHGGKVNARLIDLVAQINSSGTGATELLLGGTGGDRIIIPDQSAWSCEIHFVAKTATGAHASMQRVHGLLVRDGTATTWAAGVAETQVNIGTSNATFAVAADDTNEALKLTVTAASGTVRCVANIKLTQVDY